jgi:hypothetical protein
VLCNCTRPNTTKTAECHFKATVEDPTNLSRLLWSQILFIALSLPPSQNDRTLHPSTLEDLISPAITSLASASKLPAPSVICHRTFLDSH